MTTFGISLAVGAVAFAVGLNVGYAIRKIKEIAEREAKEAVR